MDTLGHSSPFTEGQELLVTRQNVDQPALTASDLTELAN
jgi:hypothetical protein